MSKILNAIVYTGKNEVGRSGYITYHKINNIQKFKTFIDLKYPSWKFFTTYDHTTKEKIEVVKK